jgi:hypothetical protein
MMGGRPEEVGLSNLLGTTAVPLLHSLCARYLERVGVVLCGDRGAPRVAYATAGGSLAGELANRSR